MASIRRRPRALNLSILLVNPRASAPYADAMRLHGWTVALTTLDRARALVAASSRPDVIVIEQGTLPPAAAFDLARHLRNDTGVATVVLSNLRVPEVNRQAQAAGCIVISTPCRPMAVVTGVQSAAALRSWLPRRKIIAPVHT